MIQKLFSQIIGKSIRRQLIFGVAVVHLVLMSIFVYDLTDRQKKFLFEKALAESQFQVMILASSSREYLRTDDLIGLQEVVETLSDNQSVSYAMVVSTEGKVLSHTDRNKRGLYLKDSLSQMFLNGPKRISKISSIETSIEYVMPIFEDRVMLGWARISHNLSENKIHIEYVNRQGIFYTLLAILVGTLFAFILSRVVLRQLNLLLIGAERLGKHHLYNRVPIVTDNEVGVVSKAFNTALHEIEQKNIFLLKSEEKYRTVVENIKEAIFQTDVNGTLLFLNKAWEEITEYALKDSLGRFIWDFVHPEDKQLLFELFDTLISQKKSFFRNEIRYLTKSGNSRWIEVYTHCAFNDKNEVIGTYGTFLDVTERKKAEESIAALALRNQTLLQTANDGIHVLDEEGNVIEVNAAFCKMLGYSREELLQLHVADWDAQWTREELLRNIHQMILKPTLFETEHRRKDGTIRNVEINAVGVTLEGRDYLYAAARDITERKLAEEKIKSLQQYNRGLIEASLDPLVTFDREFKILDVNKSTENATGRTREELIGTSFPDYFTDTQRAVNGAKLVFEKGEVRDYELVMLAKDGNEIFVSYNAVVYKNQNGEVVGAFAAARDITERKLAEVELKKSEEKLKTVLDLTYTWEYWIDGEANVVYMSPSVEKITGYKEECFLKDRSLLDTIVLDKKIWEEHICESEYVENRDRYSEVEFRILTSSGDVRWIHHTCKRVRDKEGNYLGVRVSNRDITENKKSSELIAKLSTAIEQSPVSIFITDLNGKIEYANPKFSEITGYTTEEVLGHNPKFLQSGTQSIEFFKDLWDTILSGKIWSSVFHNKKKNGEFYWESAIITPIKNEIGEITNFVAIKEDITDKIEKEIELQKYREHLEELVKERTEELDKLNNDLFRQLQKETDLKKQLAESLSKEKEINELKTRFIATVSHEFRTPLASLFSSAQLIQRFSKKWSDEKLSEHYNRIEAMVTHLTSLLDDVLTISKADREILINKPELIDIEVLVESFVEELKPSISEKHNFSIVINCAKRNILIDKKLLNHVVVNLLTNAFKYSPNGGNVTLSVSCENSMLKIIISDQGIGIKEEEIKNIFEPFYRSKTFEGVQGSGLGLNITKRAIEILGGKISVISKVNEGTTFTVNIPVNEI